jgi:hypothetical protein
MPWSTKAPVNDLATDAERRRRAGRKPTELLSDQSEKPLKALELLLQQAGAPHRWWSRALRHYCFLHNVMRPPNGGLSPYELRHGVAFAGPLLAFGSEICYKSAVSDPNGPGNKLGPSSKQGVVVGYFMNPGGAWSKDYIVFDLEAVRENRDCRRVRTRRRGDISKKRGLPHFPMLTREAQDNLVPPLPPAPMPEVLQPVPSPAPGDAPAQAEAVQRPVPEVQQAEPAPPVKVDIEKKPKKKGPYVAGPPYKTGQFVDPANFYQARVPKGYTCEDGRIARANRTDSTPPASIWPEMWAIMTPKEKREAKLALMPE